MLVNMNIIDYHEQRSGGRHCRQQRSKLGVGVAEVVMFTQFWGSTFDAVNLEFSCATSLTGAAVNTDKGTETVRFTLEVVDPSSEGV